MSTETATASAASLSSDDLRFFDESFEQAEKAYSVQEVPVGCVLVYNGEVIGRGHNDVNRTKNPTRHAEMVAVEQAEEWCEKNEKNFNEVMLETTLYVTLEPCIMCASAMYQLRIRRMVFGACNERFGGVLSVSNADNYGVDHRIEVVSEVAKERTIALLRRFYDRENPFAPDEKKKRKPAVVAGQDSSTSSS